MSKFHEVEVATGPYGTELEKLFVEKEDKRCRYNAVLHSQQVADAIVAITGKYILAGTNQIFPHTFGSRLALEGDNYETYRRLIEAQVMLSKQAMETYGQERKIQLQYIPLGPHGQCYSTQRLHNMSNTVSFHSRQIETAAEFGLTPIFETTARKDEVAAIAEAAEKLKHKVIIGLVLNNEGKLLDGSSVKAVIKDNVHDFNGGYVLNCGPLDGTVKAIKDLGKLSTQIAGLYPNATEDLAGALDSKTIIGPQNVSQDVQTLIQLACTIDRPKVLLTGCCGHSPETIAVFVRAVRERMESALAF